MRSIFHLNVYFELFARSIVPEILHNNTISYLFLHNIIYAGITLASIMKTVEYQHTLKTCNGNFVRDNRRTEKYQIVFNDYKR